MPARSPQGKWWQLAGVGCGKNRRNFRKDLADAGRNARHDSAGRNGHETRHQRVFDEVLAALILPNLELQKQIFHFFLFSSPYGARQSLSPSPKYHRQVL